MASAESFVVYVIELRDAACKRTECPARRAGRPHLYVGETKNDPAARFAEHLAGGFTSASVVRKHGLRLRPRLAKDWGPYSTREESQAAEARLAERLRRKNFCVFGGH